MASVSAARGFWVVAVGFALVMAFATAPTPLYPLLQERDGFGTTMVTVVFAVYGLGVMGGLYFAGHLSDVWGRRSALLATCALETLSALIFWFMPGSAALLVARVICGIGVGMLTAAATAYLAELRARARPQEPPHLAATVATSVNTGGLALGPVIAGALITWLPHPLTVPFAAFAVAIAAIGLALLAVPETVERPEPRPAYHPQRVELDPSLDADARAAYRAGTIASASAFAVLGFFSALTTHVLGDVMGLRQPLATTGVVFALMGTSSLAQVLLARVDLGRRVRLGRTAMALGLLGIAAGGAWASLPAYVVGAVACGAGLGLLFQAGIGTAVRVSDPAHRGGTIAGMFLGTYVGLTVPVVLVGVALQWVPLREAVVGFSTVVLVTVLISTRQVVRVLR